MGAHSTILSTCRSTAVAAIALAALLSGCKKKQIALPPVTVDAATVTQRDVPIYGEWLGTLDGYINAQVRAQVSGYLLKQVYKEGTLVHKDDLLFEIDPRLFQAALDQAKAMLAQSQAQLGRTEIDVKRDTPLAAQGAISQQELDNAIQNNLAAQANVEAAKANVEKASIDLAFTRIISPVDGIAGLANAQVGDLVSPQSEPLTTVSSVDPIKVIFTISEQDYLRLAQTLPTAEARADFRQKVEFDLLLPDGRTYPHKGKFYAIQRQVDSRTGTLQFAAVFPNPEMVLRPGQFARVRARTFTHDKAVVIPQRAVMQLQTLYQVAVIGPDDKIEIRNVSVGDRVGPNWIITSGLQAGDRIVVEGVQKVHDGLTVKVNPYVPTASGGAAATKPVP